VTFLAGYLCMAPDQGETGLRMTLDRKGGAVKSRFCVAKAAIVIVRHGGKFPVVGVGMAFRAKPLAVPVSYLHALRLVAFDAGERGVLSNQRKGAAGVVFPIKKRWSKFRCPVTRRTIRAGWPRCKLPVMRIRMAILAKSMGDRPTEISFLMAFNAREFRMSSDQPEYCQIVIKTPGGSMETVRIVTLFALASAF
jgi:hypothetical protein